jgi:hypothetical protein
LSQKAGCGFPQGRICALFDLHTGVALSYRMGNKKSHEIPLFRDQMATLITGDIFLGDKGFISYFDRLNLKERGVDSVIALAKRKPVRKENAVKVLSESDFIVEWPKPVGSKTRYKLSEWQGLPETIQVRQIKVTISQPGFRVKHFYIATTLLDADRYPEEKIAELYLKRWHVETFFHDLKTTLDMDVLRCKSPDMVEKEVLMYFIVFNALKRLANDCRDDMDEPEDISFVGCRQVLNSFAMTTNGWPLSRKVNQAVINEMQELIQENQILKRFGRIEPRVKKRRPKPFKLMTKPRDELRAELMV